MSSGSCFLKPFLFSVILMNVSCASVEMVSIQNNTAETIQFRGQFQFKSYDPYNLDFILQAGNANFWRYETGPLGKKSLDEGLKRIILKNDEGCVVMLERSAIEKIATKNGMWEINIDKKVMNCN